MTVPYRHRWQSSLIFFGPKPPLFAYEIEHEIPPHVAEVLRDKPGATVVCIDDERMAIIQIEEEKPT